MKKPAVGIGCGFVLLMLWAIVATGYVFYYQNRSLMWFGHYSDVSVELEQVQNELDVRQFRLPFDCPEDSVLVGSVIDQYGYDDLFPGQWAYYECGPALKDFSP